MVNDWQHKDAKLQPMYADKTLLSHTLTTLQQLPPLIPWSEIAELKSYLAKVAMGDYFILQGGDCAESFVECREETILTKVKILLQMSLILLQGLKKPILRIGRIAGQYAKPRSEAFETREGITLPSYQGDLINSAEFNVNARIPDPNRLLSAYYHAASTLNYIRGLFSNGFADLHHAKEWQLPFNNEKSWTDAYRYLNTHMEETFSFFNNLAPESKKLMHDLHFFTSHEALVLAYESALTRTYDGLLYNSATHFPWIGMRTNHPEEAHIAYARQIANPLAIKIGPTLSPQRLVDIISVLDPHCEVGKLTLIHRLGKDHIESLLPPLIAAVNALPQKVIWCCDPMHGNTHKTKVGIKTRYFDDILQELEMAFFIHNKMGTYLGGVHFEMTGENVTECLGGASGLVEADLNAAYKSLVDPRLNYMQSLEIATFINRCVVKKELTEYL